MNTFNTITEQLHNIKRKFNLQKQKYTEGIILTLMELEYLELLHK